MASMAKLPVTGSTWTLGSPLAIWSLILLKIRVSYINANLILKEVFVRFTFTQSSMVGRMLAATFFRFLVLKAGVTLDLWREIGQ